MPKTSTVRAERIVLLPPVPVIPTPYCPIKASRGEQRPVWAERRAPYRAGVAGEGGYMCLGGGIPQPYVAVVSGGGQEDPVRAERHTTHRANMAGECPGQVLWDVCPRLHFGPGLACAGHREQ